MKHRCTAVPERKAFVLCAMFAFLAIAAGAGAEAAPGGAVNSASATLIVATTLETKIRLTDTLTIPVLRGSGAFAKDNNLKLKAFAEASPVSANAGAEAVLTPIAYLQIFAGGSIGTGWNIPIADGLRTNEPELDAEGNRTGGATLEDRSFGGIVWSAKAGGTFQFDLGAVVPGDWSHAVFQTTHSVQYRAFTGAQAGESWLYEADDGENRNGWNYYGSAFLGYRPPPRSVPLLEMFGVLAENDAYLYGTSGGDEWGDEMGRIKFGPVLAIRANDRFVVSVLAQWRTVRNYTEETRDFAFYQDRILDSENPSRIEFYRAAVNAVWKLK